MNANARSANAIPVKCYHNIFLWPLLLDDPKGSDSRNIGVLDAFVEQLTCKCDCSCGVAWRDVSHEIPDHFSYESAVYFHPFVRDFVFGDGSNGISQRNMRLLSSEDLNRVEVTLSGKTERIFQFNVPRVYLVVCKPNVALLVVEVEHDTKKQPSLTLADALDLGDQFRRCYPAFWLKDEPQHFPLSVKWYGASDDKPLKPRSTDFGLDAKQQDFRQFTADAAEPPVFSHWDLFFSRNMEPFRGVGNPAEKLTYRQVCDDRMPTMTFIGVDDLGLVSKGDFDRLTFVDSSGQSDYPYQEQFLAATRAEHCYDRFEHYGTRYLCSGYGFTAIGTAGEKFVGFVRDHFRGHYLIMGILAHYQRAALLYFADALSEAKKLQAEDGKLSHVETEIHDPRLRKRVQEIQWQFIKFRTRAFFPEVTNHLQGKELFELWFDQLETQKLFDQVDANSGRLTDTLLQFENQRISDIANVAVVIGLLLAFVATVVPFLGDTAALLKDATGAAWVLLVFSIVVAGYGLFCSFRIWKGKALPYPFHRGRR